MISINASGRLAAQPELVMGTNTSICEFTLIDTRFERGVEHLEAVKFVCYGEDAERICSSAVKGQMMEATGTQVTQRYEGRDGQPKSSVKYRLTWHKLGFKPKATDRGANAYHGRGPDGEQSSSGPPAASASAKAPPKQQSEPGNSGFGPMDHSGLL